MSDTGVTQEYPPLTSLPGVQRRVLGVLIEKGLTVPDSYPLTLNSLITGCNQKSNREPVTHYSDSDVQDAIESLRAIGLAAVVYPDSGRTERYRHYFRKRFANLSEPQVAIMTELLLRGRQSVGDLRARASRMAPPGSLESLDQLRNELNGLLALRFIQADGSLDRRGVEVDHAWYESREAKPMTPRIESDDAGSASHPEPRPMPAHTASGGGVGTELNQRISSLEATCAELQDANRRLRDEFAAISKAFDDLKRSLGG